METGLPWSGLNEWKADYFGTGQVEGIQTTRKFYINSSFVHLTRPRSNPSGAFLKQGLVGPCLKELNCPLQLPSLASRPLLCVPVQQWGRDCRGHYLPLWPRKPLTSLIEVFVLQNLIAVTTTANRLWKSFWLHSETDEDWFFWSKCCMTIVSIVANKSVAFPPFSAFPSFWDLFPLRWMTLHN